MRRSLLSLFLALLIIVQITPVLAADGPDHGSVFIANPMFPETAEQPALFDAGEEPESLENPPLEEGWLSVSQAAAQLRQAMVNRQTITELYVDTGRYLRQTVETPELSAWFNQEFIPLVYGYEYAQSPFEGDYLRWSWSGCNWNWETEDHQRFKLKITFTFFTTPEEEAYVHQQVAELAGTLGLANLAPLEAYTAIYDYITTHVRYDIEGENAYRDGDPSNDNDYIFSAYGALRDGAAVCQGFATLYYALCRQADLPVRALTTRTHIWNIVYLKDMWYEVDCTWDSLTSSHRQWFLLGRDAFEVRENHVPRPDYWDAAFFARYPVSRYNYDPDIPFSDVPRSNYHYGNIKRACELGLFNGTDVYRFSPEENISRAMLVTVLWRMEDKPWMDGNGGFSDVAEGEYYTTAVAWACKNGIVKGKEDNRFDPDGSCTREELVTFLCRYVSYLDKITPGKAEVSRYTDWNEVSDWARNAMAWAIDNSIISGTTDTTLSPLEGAIREQLATVLIRLIDRYQL